jgi:hypothetical protein
MKKLFRILAVIVLVLFVAFFAIQKKSIPIEELKKKYTTAASKFLELDGMQVHYKIEGEGKPIVLIHGTGANLANVERLDRLISEKQLQSNPSGYACVWFNRSEKR